MTSRKEEPEQLVIVVDDDESMRVALSYLFKSMDLAVRMHHSAADMMSEPLPDVPCCLVLDIRLPGISGLEFQDVLARNRISIPIVFMTGHGDIPMSVRAMKGGALDFLTKPFRDQDMLDAVMRGLADDKDRRDKENASVALRERFETLTPRQAELFKLVASGLMNKQIADILKVSEVTVKIHRGVMMKKMEARSVVDLVKKAELLGLR